MTWRARIIRDLSFDCASVMLAKTTNAETEIVTGFEVKKIKPGEMNSDFLQLPECEATEFLQAIMDAAYDFGLRPSRAQDESHLKAHLQDMRAIAMHKLGMNK